MTLIYDYMVLLSLPWKESKFFVLPLNESFAYFNHSETELLAYIVKSILLFVVYKDLPLRISKIEVVTLLHFLLCLVGKRIAE